MKKSLRMSSFATRSSFATHLPRRLLELLQSSQMYTPEKQKRFSTLESFDKELEDVLCAHFFCAVCTHLSYYVILSYPPEGGVKNKLVLFILFQYVLWMLSMGGA